MFIIYLYYAYILTDYRTPDTNEDPYAELLTTKDARNTYPLKVSLLSVYTIAID